MKYIALLPALFLALLTALGAACIFCSVAGFIPGCWLCDLFSQFRLIYGVAFLLSAFVTVVTHRRIGLALFLLCFVVNGLPIVETFLPRECVSNANSMQNISILLFNTEFQHNLNYGLFDNIILQRQPDIIALVEVDQTWLDNLSGVMKPYPYMQMSPAGAGMALYSKLPIEKVEVRYFGVSHHPRIFAVLKAGEKKINLLVVHPTTPKTETAFKERSTEMRLMSEEMNSVSAPKVLLGDMNCGPWSPAFATFAQNGLVDSERNFCLQPSWPARTGRVLDNVQIPPLIPIDHVLVSPDVCVLERRAGPAIESDHLPVFTRLAL